MSETSVLENQKDLDQDLQAQFAAQNHQEKPKLVSETVKNFKSLTFQHGIFFFSTRYLLKKQD